MKGVDTRHVSPLRLAGWILSFLAWAWACGALHYLAKVPAWAAIALMIGVPIARMRWPFFRPTITGSAAVVVVWMLLAFLFFEKPSVLRNWWDANRRPPVVRYDGKIEFDPDVAALGVQSVRHFKWRTSEDFVPAWVFETFYLDRLDALDLVVARGGDSGQFAQTLLSFGFGREQRVVISVDARREKGERFGWLPVFYKQFELFYQINSERDALTLRAIDPDAELFVFPVEAPPEVIRRLFLDLIRRAAELVDKPVFYRMRQPDAAALLFAHLEGGDIDADKLRRLRPLRSAEHLHEMGWMDSDLDFPAALKRFEVADKVRSLAADPDFSAELRGD